MRGLAAALGGAGGPAVPIPGIPVTSPSALSLGSSLSTATASGSQFESFYLIRQARGQCAASRLACTGWLLEVSMCPGSPSCHLSPGLVPTITQLLVMGVKTPSPSVPFPAKQASSEASAACNVSHSLSSDEVAETEEVLFVVDRLLGEGDAESALETLEAGGCSRAAGRLADSLSSQACCPFIPPWPCLVLSRQTEPPGLLLRLLPQPLCIHTHTYTLSLLWPPLPARRQASDGAFRC